MRNETARKILARSDLYCKIIEKNPGGAIISKRHSVMESLFSWPNLVGDVHKIQATLEEEGIYASLAVLKKDLMLYKIIYKALEYGRSGQATVLAEAERRHNGEVPVLKCFFGKLKQIIIDIDRSFRKEQEERKVELPKSEPSPAPKPSQKKQGKTESDKADLEGELRKARRIIRQQALKIADLSRSLAGLSKEIKDAEEKEKELLLLQTEYIEEVNRLREDSLANRNQLEELNAKLAANEEVFRRAKQVLDFFRELEDFYIELKKPLEILEPIAEAEAEGGKEEHGEDNIDVIARMPKRMETNRQEILPGQGFQKSIDLLTRDERQELLEALVSFSKSGGGRASFCTQKFGRSTEFSRSGAKLSLTSNRKLGFTWSGGKSGHPTTIYEAVRLD